MNKLLMAILAQSMGGLIVFFQLQGWVAWPDKPWMKSIWWMYATSIAIAPLFFYSAKWSYEYFGAFWNMRLIGFGIGTVIFGMMAWGLLGEIPTMKTVISLILAIAIILIQITT